MDLSNSPDIQTETIIRKATKQFFEIFNEKYVGDILKFAYNTGRYSDGTNTKADVALTLIAKQDALAKQVLKDANALLESEIDRLVKNGLSRNIAIPVSIENVYGKKPPK